jgi:gamma-glutamylcyclotransferase (GGCT)/AIG2-like uncharacterized protein YtfP
VFLLKGFFLYSEELNVERDHFGWRNEFMLYFAYGIIAYGKENPFFSRNVEILTDNAWVKGVLYDTGLGFPALTSGNEIIKGKLIRMDEHTLETLLGMAKQYDDLNEPYTFKLKSVITYTDSGVNDAVTLMYETAEGLARIDDGSWS